MTQQKPFPCIVPGCKREFPKSWGAQVHFSHKHQELGKWRQEWDGILKARQQLSSMPQSIEPVSQRPSTISPQRERFITTMIEELRKAPEGKLTTGELVVALRESGITKSKNDDSLRTRISTEARNNSGVIRRVERGLYALARSAQLSPVAIPSVIPSPGAAEGDAETMILMLRRWNQKKEEAIMGLTRIICGLAID